MPKFVKMSADEAQSKRKDHLAKSAGQDNAIVKAAKAPASWNKDQRSARFVMSTQAVDRYGDIVMTDGIDTTEFERNPVGLLFHSSRSWPVGSWGELAKELNRRPPRLEGTLAMLPEGGPVKEIDEAAWMIANGGVRACSIGFMPDWDNVEGIVDDEGFWTGLKFNASTLLECSVCSVPANSQALIKQADGDPRLARELLEDVLDNWTRSPEGLLMPRAEFEAAYRVTTEKIAADEIAPVAGEVWSLPKQFAGLFTAEQDAELHALAATDAKAADAKAAEFKAALDAASNAADELAIFRQFVSTMQDGDVLSKAADIIEVEPKDGYRCFEKRAGAVLFTIDAADGTPRQCLSVESVTDEHEEIIEARVSEIAAAKAAAVPENKTETPVSNIVLNVSADTSEVEAAAKKVEGIFGRLAKQFPMFFPKAIEERIEPTIVPTEPPVPPTGEAISAAKAKAAAVRERLAGKGLIAA